jgi:hypothetical protein
MGKFQNSRYLQTLRSKIRKRAVMTLLGLNNNNDHIEENDCGKSNHKTQNKLILKSNEDQDDEEDLEKMLLEKAKLRNNNEESSLKLVHDTHFLTFKQTTDLFTLLYTSIIFKWIKSERVSETTII